MSVHSCDHCCTRVEGLSVSFGPVRVLENVNLHVNCRELLAIVGPNGAGKSTLLRAMLGELPYEGSMSFRVRGDLRRDIRIGYVPQRLDFEPDSPVSVRDFIALAASRRPAWTGVSRRGMRRAREILEPVAASHLLGRRIGELSGGELQRLLLALAIESRPEMLLLDEPVSAVDAKGLARFYQIVNAIREESDVSVIMVTHDLLGIAPHADRMILLNRTVVAEGRPEDLLSNKDMIRAFGAQLWEISRFPNGAVPRAERRE